MIYLISIIKLTKDPFLPAVTVSYYANLDAFEKTLHEYIVMKFLYNVKRQCILSSRIREDILYSCSVQKKNLKMLTVSNLEGICISVVVDMNESKIEIYSFLIRIMNDISDNIETFETINSNVNINHPVLKKYFINYNNKDKRCCIIS